ncbi:putative ErfK/YbiS/YcfS/YnhG protein [Legionella moravica]|uniref:ErfK/YbiS/YcfS/YnhG protein n=1 Tax=Legionella moravica TaxID=39962 RepID=A0A378K4A1_9GAMM|nr:L,D-transpeptidase [Legionella moravica]KTD35543.1 putative ErfK/YbiS/YcfS/YnhG protein [Legionella moravica]STX62691.1 putative ErfK/YbiS/YcfS/YnhG protein [Legionella moravica]
MHKIKKNGKTIYISIAQQEMNGFENKNLTFTYPVSTGKNGAGEIKNSECTPRGWHRVYSIIGLEQQVNSVLVARKWTGEMYSEQLAEQFPGRDWILTRIIQLEGLEPGRNKGGNVDTLERYIYIHGTPDSTRLGIPGSHGCIRLNNNAVIELANWVTTDTLVYIQ